MTRVHLLKFILFSVSSCNLPVLGQLGRVLHNAMLAGAVPDVAVPFLGFGGKVSKPAGEVAA